MEYIGFGKEDQEKLKKALEVDWDRHNSSIMQIKVIRDMNLMEILWHQEMKKTVKQVNFADNLISQIRWTVQICKVKFPQNFKFHINSNEKICHFHKNKWLQNMQDISQFVKKGFHKINLFFSTHAVSRNVSFNKEIQNLQITVFVSPALAGKTHRDHFVPCCCCCLLLTQGVFTYLAERGCAALMGRFLQEILKHGSRFLPKNP